MYALLSLAVLPACDTLYGEPLGGGETAAWEAAPEAPEYTADVEPIWLTSCAGSSCHTEGGASGGLALDVGEGALVEQPSGQSALSLVAPGDPDASYLWRKLEGSHQEAGGSGSAMPLGGELGEVELETVWRWIERAGAAGAGDTAGDSDAPDTDDTGGDRCN